MLIQGNLGSVNLIGRLRWFAGTIFDLQTPCILIYAFGTLIRIALPMGHLPYGWLMDAERILDSVFFIPLVKDTKSQGVVALAFILRV